jgi:hypothetical protein
MSQKLFFIFTINRLRGNALFESHIKWFEFPNAQRDIRAYFAVAITT